MDIYQVFLKLSYHAEPNPKHYLCYTFIGIFFFLDIISAFKLPKMLTRVSDINSPSFWGSIKG